MPYLRSFQHFRAQKHVHQEMVKPTIANFFAIVLQYNSKVRIVLQQYSKKYTYILLHRPFLSPLNSLFNFFLSLLSLLSSLFFIQTQTPSFFSLPSLLGLMFGSLVMVHGWVVGPVFGSSVTAWVQCLGPVVGRGFIYSINKSQFLSTQLETFLLLEC